jgi:hypothetical protein
MDTIKIRISGKTQSGFEVSLSGAVDTRSQRNEAGRVYTGGVVTSVHFIVDDIDVVYARPDVENWVLQFADKGVDETNKVHPRSDSHRPGDYAKMDLKTNPQARDMGPDIESLTKHVVKSLNVTVPTEQTKLQAELQAKDALIAALMEKLGVGSPEELTALLGK